jgi:hypothetical protein
MLNGASEATWREDGGLMLYEREVAGLALARREAMHAHPFVAINIAPDLEKGSQ